MAGQARTTRSTWHLVLIAAFAVVLLAYGTVSSWLPSALAQDTSEQEDRSYLIGLVESQISTPNMQFRINNIQGVLSSDATIGEITIADREGIWLRITNARIVWTRSALLLGRLSIDTLRADRIDVIRKPLPEEGALPPAETTSFQVPELPVSVSLGQLQIDRATFAADIFGLQSEISATGRLQLADGSLDTGLDITRLDGPGGKLTLAATYANSSSELNLDLALSEPANGVVANLLGVEGRPPMALSIKGAGPIDNLNVALTLDADSQRVLTGATALSRRADGLGFAANLEGPVSRLISPVFRQFFGTDSKLTVAGVARDAGGVVVDEIDLASGALTLKGNAETTPDGFLRRLSLDADIADPNAQKVILPVAGGETRIERASFDLSFGEQGENWTGKLDLDGLETGTFTAAALDLDLGGLAQNLDQPADRLLTFAVKGAATGIESERADINEALGDRVDLDIEGAWRAGQPLELPRALLSANDLSAGLSGTIAEYVYNGSIDVKAASIAPFSELAGRDMAGGLELKAQGQVTPIGGGFDLVLDGTGSGLQVGTPAADNLIRGTTRITGRVARGEQGLVTDRLRVFNDQVDILADGRYATGTADFDLDLALSDLRLLSERASGRMTAKGRAEGRDGVIALKFNADVPEGALSDKSLRQARVGFDGFARNEGVDGKISGDAFLDGNRVTLTGDVASAPNGRSLNGFVFQAGGATAQGDIRQDASGLLDGTLTIDAADVSTAAALALVEATGAARADIRLSAAEGKQQADVSAQLRSLRADQARIDNADIRATIADLFNVPIVNGSIRATGVAAGGVTVTRLDGEASSQGAATDFRADATLDNGTEIGTRGALSPEAGGYRVRLEALDLRQGQLSTRLAEPASVLVQGQNVTVDAFTLDAGGGRVAVRGEVTQTLGLDVNITRLPLAIANAVKPDLALGGTLDGTARIGGTRAAPDIRFDIDGRQLSAAALKRAGLSSLTVDASGTSTADRLNLDASVTSPEGLRATARGGVPLAADGRLDLDIDLNAFPLATLNAAVPGQGLAGAITGTAKVTGTRDDPAANFEVRGTGIRATALDQAGLAPLEVNAAGNFADNAVALRSATVRGPQGFSLDGSGRIPLSGPGLEVRVNGEAPLSLANRFLADRGSQASGNLSLSATVGGSIASPAIRGMFSTQGAQFVDPESNLRLEQIAVMGTIDGDQVVLRNASAAIGSGGRVSASGTVSTNAAAGFPADIRVTLDQARYADGNMVVATVNGALRLAGPVTRNATLSGNIDVQRAEITVPDSLGSSAAQIDVRHKNASRGVEATLERAKVDEARRQESGRSSGLQLNVTVNAPNRIFVRGRGLDTELGGEVTLTGPATDIQPVGGFRLIRGRLGILGQRIEFDEGTVTLVGDLDPFIDFVARSESNDITVFINVRGRVSDLDISFSSQPELPQDEVLARLIFNRSINELSAFQIAQLAAAAAELAGGQNTSLLGSLRQATGLDDLDVVTDQEGNAAVRAGRYINDNIYLGVEAGAGGATRGTVNLDITEDLKAKGAVGSDGDSSVGIFYEKDY